jgi:hypothetical protein
MEARMTSTLVSACWITRVHLLGDAPFRTVRCRLPNSRRVFPRAAQAVAGLQVALQSSISQVALRTYREPDGRRCSLPAGASVWLSKCVQGTRLESR